MQPQVRQGFYLPLSLRAAYEHLLSENNTGQAALDYNAEHYLDPDLGNADRHDYSVSVADILYLGHAEDSARMQFKLFHGAVHRQYYDHDTGLDKETSSGSNVANRYQYENNGASVRWQRDVKPFEYKIYGTWQQRDYADPVVISQLDHTYYQLKGTVGYRHDKFSRYSAGYSYFVYDYAERPARDIAGRLLSSNPALTYRYQRVNADLRHKLAKNWNLGAGLEHTTRTDDYQGYNDYAENVGDLSLDYRIKKGVKASADFRRWLRDYANAFAYDNVLREAKKSSGYDSTLALEFTWHKVHGLDLRLEQSSDHDADARYAFARSVISCIYKWSL